MLTKEHKKAIVSYLTGWSIKPIFEDIDEIGNLYDPNDQEEEFDQLENEVGNFLDECAAVLEEWVNKNE